MHRLGPGCAREDWSRLGVDEFHRSVSMRLAERGSRSKKYGASGSRRSRSFHKGFMSSQAIEQLTISGSPRHGQPELENHLRLRAPMAWQDIQTEVEKNISPQSVTNSHHNQCAVLTGAKCQICRRQTHQRSDCRYKDETCKTCGKRGHWAKVCRSGNAQTPRHVSPKRSGKASGKG